MVWYPSSEESGRDLRHENPVSLFLLNFFVSTRVGVGLLLLQLCLSSKILSTLRKPPWLEKEQRGSLQAH